MKLRKEMILLCAVSTLVVSAGCGSGPSGNYNITQTMSGAASSACQSSQAQMSINANGQSVSGSASNQCFSENFTATDSGGSLTGVTLTITPTSQAISNVSGNYNNPYNPHNSYNNPYYGNSNGAAGQSCAYVGTLSFSNNQISGTLTLQNSGSSNYYYNSGSSCPSSISINGSKS